MEIGRLEDFEIIVHIYLTDNVTYKNTDKQKIQTLYLLGFFQKIYRHNMF